MPDLLLRLPSVPFFPKRIPLETLVCALFRTGRALKPEIVRNDFIANARFSMNQKILNEQGAIEMIRAEIGFVFVFKLNDGSGNLSLHSSPVLTHPNKMWYEGHTFSTQEIRMVGSTIECL
jgi:hypothetical protein